MTRNRFTRYGLPAITLAALLLAAPMANAEVGSRLCGYSADMPPNTVLEGMTLPAGGKIGMLYELRQGDNSAEGQCNHVKATLEDIIAKNSELRVFAWRKADYLVNKKGHVTDQVTCEALGAEFTSPKNPNADMCAYMDQKATYTVVKVYNSTKKTAESTTYSQQKGWGAFNNCRHIQAFNGQNWKTYKVGELRVASVNNPWGGKTLHRVGHINPSLSEDPSSNMNPAAWENVGSCP